METLNYLSEALGAGIFVFCLLAGMGACFYIMEHGLKFKKKGKKNGNNES